MILSGWTAYVTLVAATLGFMAAVAVTLHARSTRKHLRAILAEARRGNRQSLRLLAGFDTVKSSIGSAAPVASASAPKQPSEFVKASGVASDAIKMLPTHPSGNDDGDRELPKTVHDVASRSTAVVDQDEPAGAQRPLGASWHVPLEPLADPKSLIDLPDGEIATEVHVRGNGKLALELDLRSPSKQPRTGAARVMVESLDAHLKPSSRNVQSFAVDYTPGLKKVLSFDVPDGTARVRLGVSRSAGVENLRMLNSIRVREIQRPSRRLREARDVRVAMIADEFTHNSLKYECDSVSLHPGTWREQMEEHAPELLFCESAWAGTTPDRPWRGQIYASNSWSSENRTTLLEILDYCRRQGIPTVFWNKEDPSHYDDRRHDFTRTAVLFDHIFTTDEDCVDRYRLEWGARSVDVLPFAAQPRLYNPISSGDARHPGVIFAGSWYGYHPARSEAMSSIFDGILKSGNKIVIYDRYFGDPDPNHLYPEKYSHLTRPAVPHAELARIYKRYQYGLNFNTETRSPTMFARRVFELAMSGTVVLTNYSRGVERFFGDQVVYLDREADRLERLSAEDEARMRASALETVLEHHTYGIRMAQVFDRAGIDYRKPDARVDAYAQVNSVLDIGRAKRAHQSLGSLGGKLTLVPGPTVASQDVQAFYEEGSSGSTIVIGQEFIRNELERTRTGRAALVLGSEPVNPVDVRRAMLHLSYADDGIAIGAGEPFTYGEVSGASHRLYAPEQLSAETLLQEQRLAQAYRI
ncbi:glycosyltransferase [Cellulosimicrobium cellulans]|uniref:CgeB family protein n=1 Tax=Cellulosimicrobium cellulans TaxID=1710 RepID=UPI00381A7450